MYQKKNFVHYFFVFSLLYDEKLHLKMKKFDKTGNRATLPLPDRFLGTFLFFQKKKLSNWTAAYKLPLSFSPHFSFKSTDSIFVWFFPKSFYLHCRRYKKVTYFHFFLYIILLFVINFVIYKNKFPGLVLKKFFS